MATRLAELARKEKLINDQDKEYILLLLRKMKRGLLPLKLTGRILVDEGMIHEADLDRLLIKQEKDKKASGFSLFTRIENGEHVDAILALACIAMSFVLFLGKILDMKLSLSVSTATFAFSKALASYRLRVPYFQIMMAVGRVFLGLIVFLFTLTTIEALHKLGSTPFAKITPFQIGEITAQVRVSLLLLLGSVTYLVAYAYWKYEMLRFTEARITRIKDLIMQIDSILKEPNSNQFNWCLGVALSGVRDTINLNAGDHLLDRFSMFWRLRRFTSACYLRPDSMNKVFVVAEASWPPDAPNRTRDHYQWLVDHYQPVFLDESKYEEKKAEAKGANPQKWKGRYRNLPDRHTFISATGWTFAKKVTLRSPDASKCLAFDNSFIKRLRTALPCTNRDLSWIKVDSFIATPVLGLDGNPVGVLLVMKNAKRALTPEDVEVTAIAARLLRRALMPNKEGVVGVDV